MGNQVGSQEGYLEGMSDRPSGLKGNLEKKHGRKERKKE